MASKRGNSYDWEKYANTSIPKAAFDEVLYDLSNTQEATATVPKLAGFFDRTAKFGNAVRGVVTSDVIETGFLIAEGVADTVFGLATTVRILRGVALVTSGELQRILVNNTSNLMVLGEVIPVLSAEAESYGYKISFENMQALIQQLTEYLTINRRKKAFQSFFNSTSVQNYITKMVAEITAAFQVAQSQVLMMLMAEMNPPKTPQSAALRAWVARNKVTMTQMTNFVGTSATQTSRR